MNIHLIIVVSALFLINLDKKVMNLNISHSSVIGQKIEIIIGLLVSARNVISVHHVYIILQ